MHDAERGRGKGHYVRTAGCPTVAAGCTGGIPLAPQKPAVDESARPIGSTEPTHGSNKTVVLV